MSQQNRKVTNDLTSVTSNGGNASITNTVATKSQNNTGNTGNPVNSGQGAVNPKYKEMLKSPLVVTIPTQLQPTEILAQRFASWRSIIRSLLVYLQETCSIQDEIVRQQIRLSHAINFPFNNNVQSAQFISSGSGGSSTNANGDISFSGPAASSSSAYSSSVSTPSSGVDGGDGSGSGSGVANKNSEDFVQLSRLFAPYGSGSIQDVPYILAQYHNSMIQQAQYSSRELSNAIIPRLEDLRRDLLIKIKEIKELQSDFKNSCAKELHQTKVDLNSYQKSLEDAKYNSNYSKDPYLEKLQLNRQIKKQLHEENFLHEAFINLQTSGKELEKVVIMEVQAALTQFAKLMGQEAQLVFDTLITKLDQGFINKNPHFEWTYYVEESSNKKCFIPMDLPMRQYSKIQYKNQFDPLSFEIQSGFLERRSKFLKSYSRGFYVLTPTFLHEFKTGDRKKDLVPVMSLSLNNCTVAEHSKRGSTEYKFVLHAKQNGIIHRGHNWVFRCDSYDTMFMWFENLKKMTSTSDCKIKSKYVCEYLNLDPITGRPLPTTTATATATATSNNAKSSSPQNNGAVSSTNRKSLLVENTPGSRQQTPGVPRSSVDSFSTMGSRSRVAANSNHVQGRLDPRMAHEAVSFDHTRDNVSESTNNHYSVQSTAETLNTQEHRNPQHEEFDYGLEGQPQGNLDLTPNTEVTGYEQGSVDWEQKQHFNDAASLVDNSTDTFT